MPISAKKYTPRPRTQPLGRGKACLNCRHLKIKCNGAKPVCDQCQRVEKDEPCEYSDCPSRTQQLLDAVTQLQNRILELEGQRGVRVQTSFSNSLDRYTPPVSYTQCSDRASSLPSSNSASPSPSIRQHTPALPLYDSESERSVLSLKRGFPPSSPCLDLEEPPYSVMQMLLCNFLSHAQELGFFRHPGRFKRSALQSLPFSDPSRPSPSLLNAVYLWGAHFSGSALVVNNENFLRRAVYYGSAEVATNGTSTTRILDAVQTHVLLANYFLVQNKPTQAEFHANNATSLVLAFGLHKVQTPYPVPGPSADNVEEGEKINAFWTVYCLRKLTSSILERPSSIFGALETPEIDVDTPWPLDIEAYETIPTGRLQGASTITVFLASGTDGSDHEFRFTRTSFTKSFILFHEASLLANKRSEHSPEQFDVYRRTCASLNDCIVRFRSALFLRSDMPPSRICNLSHALLAAGSMVLHHIFSPSNMECRRKCLIAAESTLHLLKDLNGTPNFVNPIVVLLLSETCCVLLEENPSGTRDRGDLYELYLEGAAHADINTRFQTTLSSAISTVTSMASRSPLMDRHFQKICQKSEYVQMLLPLE